MLDFDGKASLVKPRSSVICRSHQKAGLEHSLDTIPVELGGRRIVPFLNWLVLEIIDFEEVVGGLVTAVDHHSQLGVIELISVDGLDEGDFDWVMLDVNASCAVGAQEDTVVYAHVRWAIPT